MGSRRHVPVLAIAILAVIAVAVVVAMPGDDAHDFSAKASAICERTQSSLSEQNNTPGSIAEALEIEHAAIATYRQEILELQALPPKEPRRSEPAWRTTRCFWPASPRWSRARTSSGCR
jgi:hypothetical protein